MLPAKTLKYSIVLTLWPIVFLTKLLSKVLKEQKFYWLNGKNPKSHSLRLKLVGLNR